MEIKVCGMKPGRNLADVSQLGPSYIGFIFADKSPRFINTDDISLELRRLQADIKTVGVFVDATIETIVRHVTKNQLYAVQLHGCESPGYCHELRLALPNKQLIRALSVQQIEIAELFESAVDLFIFDSGSPGEGGTGRVFDWKILKRYAGSRPFLVAGGIGPATIDAAIEGCAEFNNFLGFDINSAVESSPGVKDIKLVKQVFQRVRHGNC